MAVSSLIIRLGAEVAQATRGLRSVYSGLNNIVVKATSLKGINFAGLIGLATAGAGITGLGMKIQQLGAGLELTRMSFQTMLGDAEKGNAMLAKLNEFANFTPFSNEEIIQSGKTLLAYGVPAGNVEGLLKRLGDASAGSGKKIAELAPIFGKVFAKGKADTEALNMMTDASIPIVAALGEVYGKDAAQIYKMAETGQITAGDIDKAFTQMTSSGGIFANLMEKQAKTSSGLWSTITGQISAAAMNIGESLQPLIQEVLTVLQGWSEELLKFSTDGRAIEFFSTLAITAINVVSRIVKGYVWVREYGAAVFRAIGDIGKAVWYGIQGSAILAFTGIVKGVNALIEYVPAAFRTAGSVISAIWDSIKWAAGSAFAWVVNTVLNAVNGIIRMLNKIPGVDLKMVDKPKFLSQVEQFANEAGESAKRKFRDVANGKEFKEAGKRTAERNAKWDSTEQKGLSLVQKSSNSILNAGGQFKIAGENIRKAGASIDAMTEKAVSKVSDWQAKAQSELAAKNKKSDLGPESKITGSAKTENGKKQEKISTDSLTKIGLYGNFGGSRVPSIDLQRNKLLENILEKVGELKESGGLLA